MGPLTLCDYCNSEDGPHPLSWGAIRAKLSATERERDEAIDCGQSGVCKLSPGCSRHWAERNAELVRERDEARAMLAESKASLDRVGPIADECLQIAKTMAGSREEAAASERAAIVAWLSAREKNLLRLREGQALFGEDLTVVDGRIYELEAAIMLITRLDHHRDVGTP